MKPVFGTTPAKKQIDWEAIEKDWRAGIKSVLQIAADYERDSTVKVSHTAINKHFKKLGIPRDLKAKIRAKADALVSAALVSAEVSTETTFSDSVIIEANAQAQATVLIGQRKDITRSRSLSMKLLAEIEAQTDEPELFERLAELMLSPDDKGVDKLNELYRKVIATPSRIDSMKKLAETLKTLIALERQALGMDDERKPSDDAVADFLNKCGARALPIASDDE